MAITGTWGFFCTPHGTPGLAAGQPAHQAAHPSVLPHPPLRPPPQRLGMRVEVLDSRNATGYFNVLNDEGRAVVGALLVADPEARMPENLPDAQEPLWDRAPLMQRSGTI